LLQVELNFTQRVPLSALRDMISEHPDATTILAMTSTHKAGNGKPEGQMEKLNK
jgi:hypothetical protein